MNTDLKERIYLNQFVNKIRLDIVDEDEFLELCDLLRKLADIWNGRNLIEKDIVEEIYVIFTVTSWSAMRMKYRSNPDATRVEEMALKIDDLLINCLTDTSV